MKQQKVQSSINLETLARGAFAEKINDALMKVAENIQDPNTDATTKRGITVNIKFSPNKTRQMVNTTISVTTKLAATEALDTQMIVGTNMRTGKVEIAEYDPTRGQMSIDDIMEEGEEPDEVEDDEPVEDPAQNDGNPLDLRSRGKKQETAPAVEAAAPGRVVFLNEKAAQA